MEWERARAREIESERKSRLGAQHPTLNQCLRSHTLYHPTIPPSHHPTIPTAMHPPTRHATHHAPSTNAPTLVRPPGGTALLSVEEILAPAKKMGWGAHGRG